MEVIRQLSSCLTLHIYFFLIVKHHQDASDSTGSYLCRESSSLVAILQLAHFEASLI
jgi:hypothetical protein